VGEEGQGELGAGEEEEEHEVDPFEPAEACATFSDGTARRTRTLGVCRRIRRGLARTVACANSGPISRLGQAEGEVDRLKGEECYRHRGRNRVRVQANLPAPQDGGQFDDGGLAKGASGEVCSDRRTKDEREREGRTDEGEGPSSRLGRSHVRDDGDRELDVPLCKSADDSTCGVKGEIVGEEPEHRREEVADHRGEEDRSPAIAVAQLAKSGRDEELAS
jgi:hypothetical protein